MNILEFMCEKIIFPILIKIYIDSFSSTKVDFAFFCELFMVIPNEVWKKDPECLDKEFDAV